MELQRGKIELDGVDIKQVRLELLRQRCFISVAQDPLLLQNETLRFNIDPNATVSDETIVAALKQVGLWSHFSMSHTCNENGTVGCRSYAIPERQSILDRRTSSFNELSVGQSQLFAFCRALVKVCALARQGLKPVIVLDEVTSSLDSTTEGTIHKIIDVEFTQKGHTVIVIAHRLGALLDRAKVGSDVVVSMANGRILETTENMRSEAMLRGRQTELS